MEWRVLQSAGCDLDARHISQLKLTVNRPKRANEDYVIPRPQAGGPGKAPSATRAENGGYGNQKYRATRSCSRQTLCFYTSKRRQFRRSLPLNYQFIISNTPHQNVATGKSWQAHPSVEMRYGIMHHLCCPTTFVHYLCCTATFMQQLCCPMRRMRHVC